MPIRFLHSFFYFGLMLLTVGTVFKIQHWLYGNVLQSLGLVILAAFFVLLVAEVIKSPKATKSFKVIVCGAYIIIPVVSFCYIPAILLIFVLFLIGAIYLRLLRKKVLYTQVDILKKGFDSL